MKHYDDLVERLRTGTGLPILKAMMNEGADAIEELLLELRDCRNELCFECGAYTDAHLGACDGCKWKEIANG